MRGTEWVEGTCGECTYTCIQINIFMHKEILWSQTYMIPGVHACSNMSQIIYKCFVRV